MPSTLMGQVMEVLTQSHSTNLDDLGLDIDSFHGGLECNVNEVISFSLCPFARSFFKCFFFAFLLQVIQQELSIDGLLDINIPISNHNNSGSHTNTTQTNSMSSLSLSSPNQTSSSHSISQYPQNTSVTPPSWVH